MITVDDKTLSGYHFIDLFAGLGGFRLALESFGAKCVYSSEWDKEAQLVYEANFGEKPDGDITKVDERLIPDHDILCAGFPCQAFSISGKKRGFEDSRGTLFFDVARIIREKRPKVVFLENVKNFATHDEGRTLSVVTATMEELGYSFNAKVLNAVDYGIPQKRERVYMVCFRKDTSTTPFEFPQPFPLTTHVEDVLINENDVPLNLYVNRPDTYYKSISDTSYKNTPIRLGHIANGAQGYRIYSTKGTAITLTSHGGGIFFCTGGYLVNGKPRRLHPRECARLMGYPDFYKISDNQRRSYRQFGNSVVIDVLQYITKNIGKSLKR